MPLQHPHKQSLRQPLSLLQQPQLHRQLQTKMKSAEAAAAEVEEDADVIATIAPPKMRSRKQRQHLLLRPQRLKHPQFRSRLHLHLSLHLSLHLQQRLLHQQQRPMASVQPACVSLAMKRSLL
jgi:hypothetical protein